MSNGGSYLNSSVSLISKASIRYEGTLYSINPQEATITLSNVKSYGTEDRKVDKYLAPKDTLFEYIIFKANDIKELIVDEPLNDPAIVTATQMPSSSSNNTFPGFSNDSQNLQANGLSSDAQAALTSLNGNTNQAAGAASVSSAGQTGDRFKSRGSTPASSQARSPVSELSSSNRQKTDLNKVMSRGANQNNQQQRRGWENNGNRINTYNQARNNQPRNYNNNNQMNRRPGGYQNNSYQNNSQYSRGGAQGGYRRNDDRISSHLNNNRTGMRPNHYNNYPQQNRNMMMRGTGRKFVPQSNKKFDATLKTEFDFEKANEVFQQMVDKLDDLNLSANGEKSEKSGSEDVKEEESRTDLEKGEKTEEDANCYDKTKSFFDKISCEAIERTKGNQKKFDWKQERKLNAETFGLKITYRRNDGGFRRPGGFINRNFNQNRRYNNGNPPQHSHAPRTNSS